MIVTCLYNPTSLESIVAAAITFQFFKLKGLIRFDKVTTTVHTHKSNSLVLPDFDTTDREDFATSIERAWHHFGGDSRLTKGLFLLNNYFIHRDDCTYHFDSHLYYLGVLSLGNKQLHPSNELWSAIFHPKSIITDTYILKKGRSVYNYLQVKGQIV